MGFYLLLWAIFTLMMFIATLKLSRSLQLVFLTLTLLFLLLSIADFTGIHSIYIAAGWVGIVCGISAIYTGLAQVINNEFNKTILPL